MTWSCPIFRRWLLVSGIWLVLTGGTVVSCNSDPSGLGSGNRPPVAADSFYTLAENGTLTAFMKATDPDGDRLTFRIVAGPRIGTLRDVDSSTGGPEVAGEDDAVGGSRADAGTDATSGDSDDDGAVDDG